MARNSTTNSAEEHDDTQAELETAIHTVFKYLYADNRWYRLPKVLHKIQPTYYPDADERAAGKKPKHTKLRIAAYTLAAMLNQANVQDGHDGWFKFSTKKTEEDTGFCRKTQYNHIYFLQRCKLVYCPHRAKEVRGRREVKINYLNLYRAIQAVADSGVKVTQAAKTSGVNLTQVNGGSGVNLTQPLGKNLPESCRKKGSERKEKERTARSPASRVNGGDLFPSTEEQAQDDSPFKKGNATAGRKEKKEGGGKVAAKHPRDGFIASLNGHGSVPEWQIAAELGDLLLRKRKVVKETIKLATWANQIKKGLLPLVDGVKEVLAALKEYEKHMGEKYWPEIYCAKSLCTKWHSLQRQVRQLEEEQDGTKRDSERFSFDRKQRDDDPRYREEYI